VASGTHVNLTILGGGFTRHVILESFPPEMRRFVTIIDRVNEDDVVREYRTHDVLVSCSTYEGFGLVVPEAMSQWLPVIATPLGSASTLIRDGETGLLIPPRDADALTSALHRILADRELRERLASKAFDAVRDMTWNMTARRTLAVYARAQAIEQYACN
jgi:D-inositol-3-phosphate glycosyltransferase